MIRNRIEILVKKILKIENARYTFSQCGEDVILSHLFKKDIHSFIDIGAHHPWKLNNTAYFYLQGVRGINIEPDPEYYKLIKKERKLDINLNIGIGGEEGILPLFIMSAPTLNTFKKEEAIHLEKMGYKIKDIKEIQVKKLNTIILNNLHDMAPDLLSIDVEGMDLEIVKSIDYNKYKPKAICIETAVFKKSGPLERNDEIHKFLITKDYFLYSETPVNSIFVSIDFWDKRKFI